MNGQERTHTPPPSHRTPATQASVVLLMDSIGKNNEPKKLFPRQRVLALHCRNTKRVHELITSDDLGSPQCIIIHTGTNDLHSLNEAQPRQCMRWQRKPHRHSPVHVYWSPPCSTARRPTLSDRYDQRRGPSLLFQSAQHASSHHSSIRPWHLYDGLP